MNPKLYALGAKLADGNDTFAQATKLVVRSTKDGVMSFITGFKEQRAVNKAQNAKYPHFA